MQRVKDLYDAILLPATNEDRCTSMLVWLLAKLPDSILRDICREAGLSLCFPGRPQYRVQVPLPASRPDAVAELDGHYLVIESKMFPDSLNGSQIANHLRGARQRYGSDNVWLLLISGDASAPAGLRNLQAKHPARVGFISWRSLLAILTGAKVSMSARDSTLVEEFILFVGHLKLGRTTAMTQEELAKFIDLNGFMLTHWDDAQHRLWSFLNQLAQRMIAASSERAVLDDDDIQDELPSLFRAFKIHGWHTSPSAYAFLNILLKQIGVVLVGYQGESREKKDLGPVWHGGFKATFKGDTKLRTFTWLDEDEDEFAIDVGYFKVVEGTSGLAFDPQTLPDTDDYFYWGYLYDLDPLSLDSCYRTIPADFARLLDSFAVSEQHPGCAKRKPGKTRKPTSGGS